MYMERAEKEDKEMAESMKADADSILVFVSPLLGPLFANIRARNT